MNEIDKKATCIWLFMRERSQQKAAVAQALTRRIRDRSIVIKNSGDNLEDFATEISFKLPEYLEKAIYTVTEERRDGLASFRMTGFGDISHLYAGNEEPSFMARFCECYDDDTRHD